MGKIKKICILTVALASFLFASILSYIAIEHNPQMEFSGDYLYYVSLAHWNFIAFYISFLFASSLFLLFFLVLISMSGYLNQI